MCQANEPREWKKKPTRKPKIHIAHISQQFADNNFGFIQKRCEMYWKFVKYKIKGHDEVGKKKKTTNQQTEKRKIKRHTKVWIIGLHLWIKKNRLNYKRRTNRFALYLAKRKRDSIVLQIMKQHKNIVDLNNVYAVRCLLVTPLQCHVFCVIVYLFCWIVQMRMRV